MPLPQPSTQFAESVVTVGTGQTGSKGKYNVSPTSPLMSLVNDLQHEYASVCVLRGEYDIEQAAQLETPGFRLYGSGNVTLRIQHTDPVGIADVFPGLWNVSIERLNIESHATRTGQSVLRFGQNGADHSVTGCRFLIHPGIGYDATAPGDPMRLIDMRGVCGKTIRGNTFLPYTNVIPIYASGGTAGIFENNRIHNGLNVDLDHLAASQMFPYVRPCHTGIYLRNERQGWVHKNYIWAIGDPSHQDSVHAGIRYEFDQPTAGGECGHMEFSSNKIELCYASRAMWLQGLQYSTVFNNNTGVSAQNHLRLENGPGTGALVMEPGPQGGLSSYNTVTSNNLHNSGKMNSEASAVYLRGTKNTFVGGNHLCNLFNRYGIHIDENCTEIDIRGGSCEFNAGGTNNYPVRIEGANTGNIVVGEITGHRADGPMFVSNSALGTVWVAGLGVLGTGVYGVPIAETPSYLLSTNVRTST